MSCDVDKIMKYEYSIKSVSIVCRWPVYFDEICLEWILLAENVILCFLLGPKSGRHMA